ncbi:MAG: hypothetical protein AAF828_13360, partial [Bacteroidota bacterium]
MSAIRIDSITSDNGEFTVYTTLTIAGGVLGSVRGADADTRTFALGFRTLNDDPIVVSAFTPVLTSPNTGNSVSGLLAGAQGGPFDAQETLLYSNPTSAPIECVSSTAGCGTPHATEYNIQFTSDILPDEIVAFGIEGDGNPLVGCPLSASVSAFLPVQLTNFRVSAGRNATPNLRWETANEQNNYGFYVERSYNQRTWTEQGFVAG